MGKKRGGFETVFQNPLEGGWLRFARHIIVGCAAFLCGALTLYGWLIIGSDSSLSSAIIILATIVGGIGLVLRDMIAEAQDE